jgi:hypothetical protein
VIPYQRDLPDETQDVLTILTGDGRGGFARQPGPSLPLKGCRGPNAITAGSLGSGRQVIAVGCAQSNTLLLFERHGSAAYVSTSIPIAGGWGGIALGPLTRDGRSALVTADANRGTITILSSE